MKRYIRIIIIHIGQFDPVFQSVYMYSHAYILNDNVKEQQLQFAISFYNIEKHNIVSGN